MIVQCTSKYIEVERQRTYIYIARIRVKIIHARHTRAFLSMFLSRVDRAREISSLNSSWMRKNSQLSTLRKHIYLLSRENTCIES